jgi:microbial collagenase
MVFFDEGMAEHLAGATAADGIPPRAVLVDQVAADGANRMHVAAIVRATYGDFRFYPYAGLLFSYLDAREPGRLLALIDAVAAGDVASFDAWVNAAASDAALDGAYQAWLDDLVAGTVPSVDPSTPAFPADPFAVVSVGVVRDVVRTSPWGAGAACVVSERTSLGRWTCRGSWTGPRLAPDLPGTWAALDARADQLTADIEATVRRRGAGLPRNGNTLFGTVCRTGAVTLLGANNMLGEWSCSGTLRPQPAAALTDLQRLTADVTAAGMGAPTCAAAPDRCDLTLTTSAFPRGAADATLAAELGLRARVVADRVFTRGRGFHASTACALTGPMTTQLVGGLRTGSQTLRCTRQP